jgi:serine protease Do
MPRSPSWPPELLGRPRQGFNDPQELTAPTPGAPYRTAPAGRLAKRRPVAMIAVLAVLAGGAIGAGAVATFDHRPSPAVSAAMTSPDIPALLTKVLPGVVSIKARLASGATVSGTGMVISPEGEVLTNAHIVNGAPIIRVTRYGTSHPLSAHLLGVSLEDDLALVRIDGQNGLPTIELGTSAGVPVGAFVLAVGDALGPSAGTPEVTAGIISAEGRSVVTDQDGRSARLQNLLETDASISPESSGGPLLSLSGRVIGVNTAVAEVEEGKGFAIPVDQTKEIVAKLRSAAATRAAPAAFLGVQGMNLTTAISNAAGLMATSGVLISRVMKASPAQSAGLLEGDAIVALGGAPITDTVQLRRLLASSKAGQHLEIQVVRGSSNTTFSVTLASTPTRSVERGTDLYQ